MKLIKDLGIIFNGKKTKRRWGLYECPDCLNHFEVQTSNVKSGKSTKCRTCSAKKCNTVHGLRHHPLYDVWQNMKARCYNKKNNRYEVYGGDGVTVCDEWKDNFEAFYNWCISNGYSPDKRLDKDELCNQLNISPKIYSPETCQFIDHIENSQITRQLCKNNKSGYRGVSIKKERTDKRYVAQISVSGKKIHLGYFDTAKEAAFAYDNYVLINKLKHTRNFNESNR